MEDINNTEELNLDKKVVVKNIAGWSVGFARIESVGSVSIPANGSTRLTRNEIILQVQRGNKLFTGLDGMGSHATIYIDDAPTRNEVGFDNIEEKREQNVLTDAKIKNIFNYKTQTAFENNFTDAIKTRAEKYAVIKAIKRLKINDYNKIRFAENYTGYKVDNE